MVYLFYAFTATQLINMCNLKHSYFCNVDADIYISTGNRISTVLIQKISQSNLFNRVYVNNNLSYINGGFVADLSSLIHNEQSKKPFTHLPRSLKWFCSLIRFIINNICLVKVIKGCDNYRHYNRVFVGTFGISSPFIIKCISKITYNIPISIVEEGTINYQRSVVNLCLEYPSVDDKLNHYYWVSKIFGITKSFCLEMAEKVDEIYLYSPESYPYKEIAQIRRIPPLTTENPALSLLSVDENCSVNEYYCYRNYCYLLQDKTPIQNELLEYILSNIPSEKLILREHPWHPIIRDIERDFNLKDIFVDNSSKSIMFESIISKIDAEQFVLITTDSSAALTPKYMFNKEPYVIFLYHLTQNRSETDIKSRDELVESLRESYVNKDRIYAPYSMDDFSRYLMNLVVEI